MFGTRGLPKAGLPELGLAPELDVAPTLESPIATVGGASLGSDDGMLTSKIDQSKSDEDTPP